MPEKPEEIAKNIELTEKYSGKPIPRFLKYIGKIREIKDYEDWKKETNKLLLNWAIDYLIILAFVIFLCLLALRTVIPLPPPRMIFLAEGISILWYLVISLKKDLWRKQT
ncbi:MAG TPA: hypothetical protein ENI23_02355 [bacterium]|nr:hypothetical protein [bacterium]